MAKQVKKATPKKPAAKPAPKETRAKPFKADVKIKLLVNQCPYRKGSSRAKRFGLYRNGMTVEQAMKAGAKRSGIRGDVKRKIIALAA